MVRVLHSISSLSVKGGGTTTSLVGLLNVTGKSNFSQTIISTRREKGEITPDLVCDEVVIDGSNWLSRIVPYTMLKKLSFLEV